MIIPNLRAKLFLNVNLKKLRINGYKGVRTASNFPEARIDPAEKFELVSPDDGLGPKIKIRIKNNNEKLYMGISFLFISSN